MKKNLLLAVAFCGLMSTTAAWSAETPDSIRKALESLIGPNTAWSNLIQSDQVTITPDGKDFVIVVPAVNNETLQLPEQTVRLIDDGEFNGQSQYRIEGLFDSIKSVLTGLLPDLKLTTESADSKLTWVPHDNLIVKNAQNIKGMKLTVEPYADVSVGQMVADSLIQAQENGRMNRADSQDISDIKITAMNMILSIPSVSYQDSITDSVITNDSMTQILSSSEATSQLTIPAAFILPVGGKTPLASLSLKSQGLYQDNVFHLQTRFDKIAVDSSLTGGIPADLIPTTVTADIDVTGIGRDDFKKMVASVEGKNDADREENLKQAITEWGNNIVVRLNRVEAKNAIAGVSVTGTVQNRTGKDLPDMDVTVTITNLDKISPAPTVNQAQCDEAQKQLAAIDDKAPNADSQKMMMQFIAEQACEAKGGFLDDIRPYLTEETRKVNPDGSTEDTLRVQLKDDVMTVNGVVVGGPKESEETEKTEESDEVEVAAETDGSAETETAEAAQQVEEPAAEQTEPTDPETAKETAQ